MFNRALVLAPHTDDGELGCGATISKLIRLGCEIFYVAFSTCEESVPAGMPGDILKKELFNATGVLEIPSDHVIVFQYKVRLFNEHRQEILDDLIKIKSLIHPDIVFMPSKNDVHQDHHTIACEGLRAFKDTTIFAYEEPWNNYTFSNQAFIKLNEKDVEKKVAALSEYKSQKGRKYTEPEYIKSLLKLHGTQIGVDYAEVFEIPRFVSL